MPTFTTGARRTAIALSLTLLVATAGCSDDDSASAEPPTELLTKAKTTLDRTKSVHFLLTSSDVPSEGSKLIGGEGVAARPPAFQGKLDVYINGGTVSVEVISTGGKVYAKLPFQAGFVQADPKTLGLSDPALLIDTETGISRLVADLDGARTVREARINGEVVSEIHGTVPGKVVGDTFTTADPGEPVETKAFIVKETGELRRAVLKGPFFVKGRDSTFTLVLDRYGEEVAISAPTVS
jgi:lipoprotein LprG